MASPARRYQGRGSPSDFRERSPARARGAVGKRDRGKKSLAGFGEGRFPEGHAAFLAFGPSGRFWEFERANWALIPVLDLSQDRLNIIEDCALA